MAAYTSDQKIVWAKFGGICCNCKSYCIEPSSNNSKNTLVGEVAHIAGEKRGAKRFDPLMSEEERNRFDNLMLLCATCHKVIDSDDVKFTSAILKLMKTAHESIIAKSLAVAFTNLPEQSHSIYKAFVEGINASLQLKRWGSMSDCCLRYLLVEWFYDGLLDAYRKIAVWNLPGDLPILDEKIRSLGKHAFEFANYFEKNSSLDDRCFRELKPARWLSHDEYEQYRANSKKWQSVSRMLLDNLSLAIRDFAYAVREWLDKYFVPENKDFWLEDAMGVWNMGPGTVLQPKWIIPSGYHSLDAHDLKLDSYSFLR